MKPQLKKLILRKILPSLAVPFLFVAIFGMILIMIIAAIGDESESAASCNTQNSDNDSTLQDGYNKNPTIDEFVKKYKDAYTLSWKVGGFLPSASIAQTMVENGFNFTNPNGTSLWQAHNMGGVKAVGTPEKSFPATIGIFGKDSVDLTGTKPGTSIGDNTGGIGYAWFRDYDVGIVGKAEFMSRQTLYTSAINNTNGIATLTAIAQGGWASDPVSYQAKLTTAYNSLGVQYQWLDKEAIQKYGEKPFQKPENPITDGVVDGATSQPSDTIACDAGDENNKGGTGNFTGTFDTRHDNGKGSMTRKQMLDWLEGNIGQAYDVDGVFNAQCVDLPQKLDRLLGLNQMPSLNGYEYVHLGLADYVEHFDQPNPGDIATIKRNLNETNIKTGTNGHIGIVAEVDGDNFTMYEQNVDDPLGNGGAIRKGKYTYNKGNVITFLRPPYKKA